MAGTGAPAAALAAGADDATDRIRRLLLPPAQLACPRHLAIGLAALALTAGPVLLTVAPAVLVSFSAVCPYGVPWGTGPCVSAI